MEYLIASATDTGIKKQTNQDSYCIKLATTSVGKVLMAVICDGMGGLKKGEVASASVISAFSDWFDSELAMLIAKKDFEGIRYQWDRMIKSENQRIAEYGRNSHIQLGTTLTVILMIEPDYILIGHVGDTRIYRIDENHIHILTEDQTVVAQEVKRGRLSMEQADIDPRRNVLLQCIGASRIVEPDFTEGHYKKNQVYMLCSDGFRHTITEHEIHQTFSPNKLHNEMIMEEECRRLIELNKHRQEMDNITVILIKIKGD